MNEIKRAKRKIHTRDKHYHCLTKKLRELSRLITGNRKLLPLPVFEVVESENVKKVREYGKFAVKEDK